VKRRAPADQLIARCLDTLDRALATLPRDRRCQIVDEISCHIAEGRSALDHEGPVAINALLERVGDPRTIAAEAGAHARATHPVRWTDRVAPWILVLGGLICGVGWLVGVVLLWASPTWRTRDKLLGTFVFPGGLASASMFFSLPAPGRSCSGSAPPGQRIVLHCTTSGLVLPFPIGILMLIVVVVAPVLTVVHLERARRRSDAERWVPSNLWAPRPPGFSGTNPTAAAGERAACRWAGPGAPLALVVPSRETAVSPIARASPGPPAPITPAGRQPFRQVAASRSTG